MKCFELLYEFILFEIFSCEVLDGVVIVYCLFIVGIIKFKEYVEKVFIFQFQIYLQGIERLDVVQDVYKLESLKELICQKRGKGVCRKVFEIGQMFCMIY